MVVTAGVMSAVIDADDRSLVEGTIKVFGRTVVLVVVSSLVVN